MAIVSSNHVVVRRVMGCARSSGIDEGLQDNVAALLVQSLLHAWNIAPGASCRELPLDQELRARGQRVVTGKAGAPPRPRTYVGQAGTAATPQSPQREPWPPQSGRFWQGSSRPNQNVEEAAQATPHRAWPWPLIPARPHPIRPLPERPRRPQSTFQRPVHRINVEKLLPKKNFGNWTQIWKTR